MRELSNALKLEKSRRGEFIVGFHSDACNQLIDELMLRALLIKPISNCRDFFLRKN